MGLGFVRRVTVPPAGFPLTVLEVEMSAGLTVMLTVPTLHA
jgi:hypothetical protein